MTKNNYLTVKALNRYIAYKFESDSNLKMLYVQGEISNARFSKGHLYFVLKDDESEISAVMFANYAQTLKFTPKDGTKVLVSASINAYPKKGTYNLLIYSMEQAGLGDLYQKFLQLKEKLEKEGLFDASHKKPIPSFPKSIGVISAKNADALQDILSTIQNRYPLVKVIVYPSLVQGLDAPKSLINMINRVNSENRVDVLIIARGGGSFEDLACFNDEELARVIYNSQIPIISGVGHETDFTICDFVSDLRAPTPTGAAVLATKDKNNLLSEINSLNVQLFNTIRMKYNNVVNEYRLLADKVSEKSFLSYLNTVEAHLEKLMISLNSLSPINLIKEAEVKLNNTIELFKAVKFENRLEMINNDILEKNHLLNQIINNKIDNLTQNLNNQIDKMILLNPLNIMAKGYSITYKDNYIVTDSSNVNVDDEIDIKLLKGSLVAKVVEVKE